MRITEIEINNFKAFYGKYNIKLTRNGKNLLIYGENGSGKSSLFTALKEFFNSSKNIIDLDNFDNIFLLDSNKKQNYLKVIFREQSSPHSIQTFELSRTGLNTPGTFISETNKIKGFLDYKKLLRTYYTNTNSINIFELIVKDILSDSINPISKNTFYEDWNYITSNIKEHHWSNAYYYAKERLKVFNSGLKQILDEITPIVNELLKYFNYNVLIKFYFPGIKYYSKYLANELITLNIEFCDQNIPEYYTFLNEARLSAISTSIYLAAILNYPQALLKHKILVLDDVLIGLDSGNRMHLLKILEDKFSDYQIIIGTFDLQWFSLANQYLDNSKWTSMKLFVHKLDGLKFEIPIIIEEYPYINKAEEYLNTHDYKAASAYIRTAFEEILKKYCDKKGVKVKYKLKQEKLSSEDFWEAVKNFEDSSSGIPVKIINSALKSQIETYRTIVMNPFVHNDLSKPQYRSDLENTIQAVKDLQTALAV